MTSSREAASGIGTQSDWWLLLLFANITDNGNLLCKPVDRDCSIRWTQEFHLSATISMSSANRLVPRPASEQRWQLHQI